MRKVRIRWNPETNKFTRERIIHRFGIDYHPTINGLTDCEIKDEDWEMFLKTRDYGHFSICYITGS